MIITPLSVAVSILQQLRDYKVDKKTKINNTIQKFGKLDPRKLIAGLIAISSIGIIITCSTLNPTGMFIFILTCLSATIFLRLDKFFKFHF
jgi:1,4-dihydroxy-2-naphthoate octaprenyltransferase